jgi:FtsP/CotA-like multicopper oxidase with cupredoxin domain
MKMELLASKAYRKCTSGNVTIEFYGSEYGDWFFHCHILYHMMGGMAKSLVMTLQRDEVSRF